MIRAYPLAFIVLLGLTLIVFGANIAAFYTDWLWFAEVGQTGVFRRLYQTRLLLLGIFGVSSFVLAFVNLRLAERFAPPVDTKAPHYAPSNGFGGERAVAALSALRRILSLALLLGALGFAVISGLSASAQSDTFLRFTHPSAFGERDPQFGRDIGFYVFTLPFLRYVQGWLLVVLLLVGAAVALVYFFQKGIDSVAGRTFVAPHVRGHLSALVALALLTQAWGYYLARYNLLYGTGLIPGAGYTDIHARLPMLNVIFGVTLLAALAVLVNIWYRSLALPAIAVGLWLAASAFGVFIPGFVQTYTVRPNEGVREAPYLKRSIEATRQAYDIASVTVKDFPAEPNLTARDLAANQATLSNIRLWDYEPLLETYPQQQGLRQYYSFPDVDVDRYQIGKDYRQVWLAAREITPERLDPRAQTWPNLHLRFTHGFGVVMSPAGESTSEGLPTFYLKDIPTVSTVPGLAPTQPRIYYGLGMARGSYVVVGTKQAEIDYSDDTRGGGAERANRYDGRGGIRLSPLAKFAFSVRFNGWTTLMLNRDITGDSRLLYARRVPDRIKRVAPFLQLDTDPYPVLSEGRVVWMQDAYTMTDAYPYSAPTGKFNYIRNAVKATVDAYDGTVTLYASDENDPILKTYRRIFPGLVQPASAMPASLREHRRYPEDLFQIQRRILADYHVQDPNVFYTRADSWQIARARSSVEGNETTATDTDDFTGTMAPYYVIMRLPGEAREEFLLLSPFTPRDKENMISLLAARCDGDRYGERILYRFPVTRTVFGPEQIGKRIRSDSKISPYLSLVDQKGSRVLFGSMLIVPIEKSLLYVQPLYVKARTGDTEAGTGQNNSIPELKQVIVAFENRIAMQPTLPAALADLFGEAAANGGSRNAQETPSGTARPETGTLPVSMKALVEQAGAQYDRAQTALKAGNFEAYGREIKALGSTLQRLREREAAPAQTPKTTGP